jgi:ABC-2 type transport system permease protein
MAGLRGLVVYLGRMYIRSRLFFLINVLVLLLTLLLGYLGYRTISVRGFDSLSYVIQRLQGIEKEYLVYFLWSVPGQLLIYIIPVIMASGVFSSDYESGESAIYFSYPVNWSSIVFAKVFVAFMVSLLPFLVFEAMEGILLTVYFHTPPPAAFYLAVLLAVPVIFAVCSMTGLISSILRKTMSSTVVSMIILVVIFNIVNAFFLLSGTPEPAYLLSNDISLVSKAFSQINLIPFGNAGSVGPAPLPFLISGAFYALLYSVVSLLAIIIITDRRDAA